MSGYGRMKYPTFRRMHLPKPDSQSGNKCRPRNGCALTLPGAEPGCSTACQKIEFSRRRQTPTSGKSRPEVGHPELASLKTKGLVAPRVVCAKKDPAHDEAVSGVNCESTEWLEVHLQPKLNFARVVSRRDGTEITI